MLGGNTFLTIWNRSGRVFHRYELHVKCRHTQRTTHQSSGVGDTQTANILSTLVVRIPYVKEYLPPETWLKVPDNLKAQFFTLQPDDFVAKGIHRLELGESNKLPPATKAPLTYDKGLLLNEIVTAPELRRRLGALVMQVKAVRYSTETQLGRHIRAEGV